MENAVDTAPETAVLSAATSAATRTDTPTATATATDDDHHNDNINDNICFSGLPASESTGGTHRRSLSGSILSKLPFLRVSQATHLSAHDGHTDEGDADVDLSSPILREGRAMASGLQQQQQQQQQLQLHRRTRRRRGSLRKTALLGTRLEAREKKAVTAAALSTSRSIDVIRGSIGGQPQPTSAMLASTSTSTSFSLESERSHHSGSLDNFGSTGTFKSSWAFPDSTQQADPLDMILPSRQPHQSNSSMLREDPTSDDEDVVVFPPLNPNTIRTSSSSTSTSNTSNANAASEGTAAAAAAAGESVSAAASSSLHFPTPPSSSGSFFALQSDTPSSRQLRPTHRAKSPLATHAAEAKAVQDMGWDYSETESWGWIILVVTWIAFVIGMGSCFGVWSWAWDVGETPYAPPELEDDPTLPIVGYYPALIVMTAVMSWVWVVVAWVGMKYFKHANIPGDDI